MQMDDFPARAVDLSDDRGADGGDGSSCAADGLGRVNRVGGVLAWPDGEGGDLFKRKLRRR